MSPAVKKALQNATHATRNLNTNVHCKTRCPSSAGSSVLVVNTHHPAQRFRNFTVFFNSESSPWKLSSDSQGEPFIRSLCISSSARGGKCGMGDRS
jgi:hypothetical protein